MSVIMTLRVTGDPKALEQMAQDDPEKLQPNHRAREGARR